MNQVGLAVLWCSGADMGGIMAIAEAVGKVSPQRDFPVFSGVLRGFPVFSFCGCVRVLGSVANGWIWGFPPHGLR